MVGLWEGVKERAKENNNVLLIHFDYPLLHAESVCLEVSVRIVLDSFQGYLKCGRRFSENKDPCPYQ